MGPFSMPNPPPPPHTHLHLQPQDAEQIRKRKETEAKKAARPSVPRVRLEEKKRREKEEAGRAKAAARQGKSKRRQRPGPLTHASAGPSTVSPLGSGGAGRRRNNTGHAPPPGYDQGYDQGFDEQFRHEGGENKENAPGQGHRGQRQGYDLGYEHDQEGGYHRGGGAGRGDEDGDGDGDAGYMHGEAPGQGVFGYEYEPSRDRGPPQDFSPSGGRGQDSAHGGLGRDTSRAEFVAAAAAGAADAVRDTTVGAFGGSESYETGGT